MAIPPTAPPDAPSGPTPVGPPDAARNAGATAGPGRGRRRRGHRWSGLVSLLVTLSVLFGLAFGVLALTGKTVRLPVFAVAEIESRLNARILPGAGLPPGALVSIGAVEVTVGRDWVPRLGLRDLRLLRAGGTAPLLVLPEARLTFGGKALLRGRLEVQTLRLSGLGLDVRRDGTGAFDLTIGTGTGTSFANLAEALDAIEVLLAGPALGKLGKIEAEAMTVTLTDARAGRTWSAGDGRLSIRNDAVGIAAELSLTVAQAAGGAGARPAFVAPPARATLRLTTSRADSSARIEALVDQLPSDDLAAQAQPLFWLSVLDAPISGRLAGGLDPDGAVSVLEGTLTLGQGALRPTPEAEPVAFDAARVALTYDPRAARITIGDLTVESPSLRLKAVGRSYILNAAGRPIGPAEPARDFVTQLQLSELRIDPEGLFEAPLSFSPGAIDLRLRLDPFRIDLGQMSLVAGEERLLLRGTAGAGDAGWTAALDVGLNQITPDRLVTLWPETAVPKTRAWFAANVPTGRIFDLQASLRVAPGTEPRFALAYEFADTEVRFLRTLPPVIRAAGRATIQGNRQTLVLEKGEVVAPQGGSIDMTGSVFTVPDITRRPAMAEIRLKTDSTLAAALAILDEPPFRFLSKANQPLNLGTGRAKFDARLTLPLVDRVLLPDVTWAGTGVIRDFASETLVPGRRIAAAALAVDLTMQGLTLRGQGTLGLLPFDVAYRQSFAPDRKGRATVEGTVTLSDAALADLGIALPEGAVQGEAAASVVLDLARGQPPALRLTSDLNRMGLRLDALRWRKPAAARAELAVEATLGPRPEVTRLNLAASGLDLRGRVTTRTGGGLDLLDIERLQVGDWLDARVELRGTGPGRPPDIAVTSGSLDLRRMPDAGPEGAGGGAYSPPFLLTLDELRVTEGISFTRFRGDFATRGGLNGAFTALLNGQAALRGTVVPGRGGPAVRLVSDDAGAVMAAAGIFSRARGGSLDLTLTPEGGPGRYAGRATLADFRVQDAPALAELLSAVSVVGLLEQLNGEGLLFSSGEIDFRLAPQAVEVTRASAVGLSLGISMAGLYDLASGRLDLQGVVSPIYLVNGIGAIFSRQREGIFGFNYSLRGSADAPQVSVNPLSILTPGMFRDIFRQPPPRLEDNG